MSPLARIVLALACATLLHSASCGDQNCYTIQIGDEYIGDFPKFEFTKNVTGKWMTLVTIENPCSDLQDMAAQLVYEEVTVCNTDGFTLKINEPDPGIFSPLDVRCYIKMFGIKLPCFFVEFDMEVAITQICVPHNYQKTPYEGARLPGRMHYK